MLRFKPKWEKHFLEKYYGMAITPGLCQNGSQEVARILIEEGAVNTSLCAKDLSYSVLTVFIPGCVSILFYGLTPELNRTIQDFFFEEENPDENKS